MENFDIHRFLKILSNSKIYIIGILLLFLTMGYFYSFYYVTPLYKSSATVVLVQNDTSMTSQDTSITQSDITLNQNLLSTYTKIAKSDRVLSQVIQNLELSISVEQLSSAVTVQAVNNTEVFKISVANQNPELAATITNELLTVFSNEVKSLYNMNNVYTMDKAEITTAPYNVNHSKDLIMFGILGLFVSLGIIVTIYLFDTTIKSEQDIEEYAKLNVLSSIPIYQQNKSSHSELIVNEQPKSPIAECFKTFRTNVMFSIQNKQLHTILVTSGSMSEGKSFVSSNLAVTFAQSGKRVILVDTDMRKGRQHKIFEVSHKPGLSNCLSNIAIETNQVNINEYIQETKIPNLHIMTSGDVPPNPSELLSSINMKKFLEALNTQYDIVICDGTPCMLVSDSIILSKIVDTTVFVTANKITKLDTLLKMKKSIEMVGGHIGGAIINKVVIPTKSYQNQYYYGNHNELKKELEISIVPTPSFLHQPLHISDLMNEQPINPEAITSNEVEKTSNSGDISSLLANNMIEVKSELTQMKSLYKNLVQTTLDVSLKKDTTSTTLLQQLVEMKQAYELNKETQTKQIENLSKELSSIQQSEPSPILLEELSNIKVMYETNIQEQTEKIDMLGTKISSIELGDNTDVLEELATMKDYYYETLAKQEEQINSLYDVVSNLEVTDSSDIILNEIISIKDNYETYMEKQTKQIEKLQQEVSHIEMVDNSAMVIDTLQIFQDQYTKNTLKQEEQIAYLQNKLSEIEQNNPSDILLAEFNTIKNSYQSYKEEQAKQIEKLQQEISHIEIVDNSEIMINKLESIEKHYDENITMQKEQLETIDHKLSSIEFENHSAIILQEMDEMKYSYQTHLDNQTKQMQLLQDKIDKMQQYNPSEQFLFEISKIYHQLESFNQRFDMLEEKAKHNEYLITNIARNTVEEIKPKENKIIDIKKLNAKVIQIQDYLEKQPIELPISITNPEPILTINTVSTEIPKENIQEEPLSNTNYVVDYNAVATKHKKGFSLFKNRAKEIEEEPITLVSQILSGTNFENVG